MKHLTFYRTIQIDGLSVHLRMAKHTPKLSVNRISSGIAIRKHRIASRGVVDRGCNSRARPATREECGGTVTLLA